MAYFYVVSQHTGHSAWLILNNETHVQFLCVLYMFVPAGAADAPVFFSRKIYSYLFREMDISGGKRITIHFTYQEEILWDYWNFLF